jgi:hypothetical protein
MNRVTLGLPSKGTRGAELGWLKAEIDQQPEEVGLESKIPASL